MTSAFKIIVINIITWHLALTCMDSVIFRDFILEQNTYLAGLFYDKLGMPCAVAAYVAGKMTRHLLKL